MHMKQTLNIEHRKGLQKKAPAILSGHQVYM